MQNPLKKVELAATFNSVEELQTYLSNLNGREAFTANIAMMLTWNLCSKLIDDEIGEQNDE